METFLAGFGLALAICASPGAVTTQAVRNGLERGFRAALSVQIGALAGMALWSGLGLMGAALFAEHVMIRLAVGTLGILLMLWLMVQALRDAIQNRPMKELPSNVRSDFALGVGLSLANPIPVALWLGLGSSTILVPTPSIVMTFFLGLLSSALLWSIFLAALTAWGRRFITPQLFRLVSLVCGWALGLFAIKLALNLIEMMKNQ
jgi:threonine/homoserine/homoserine lactone efflux protein